MSDGANFTDNMQNYDMPARKAILQYLVRMGSFTSAPKIPNEDTGDDDVEFPTFSNWQDLWNRCEGQRNGWPKTIPRTFGEVGPLGNIRFRVMQWNILGQGLADGSDVFMRCPKIALSWHRRRWRLLEEITAMQPDILCMQEVDHFKFFNRALSGVGLSGFFYPKPDSPCLYIEGNNGPDGCALFINTQRFEVLETRQKILEVWGCKTNQVALFCKIRQLSDNTELWVGTTHLKARDGAFVTTMRKEQGHDLVNFMRSIAGDTMPIVLSGDLNANLSEPIHNVLLSAEFQNAYARQEPFYTTWTVRENGEYCKNLDYIYFRGQSLQVDRVLLVPSEEEIGFGRLPSFKYPSDHFALVTDLSLRSI